MRAKASAAERALSNYGRGISRVSGGDKWQAYVWCAHKLHYLGTYTKEHSAKDAAALGRVLMLHEPPATASVALLAHRARVAGGEDAAAIVNYFRSACGAVRARGTRVRARRQQQCAAFIEKRPRSPRTPRRIRRTDGEEPGASRGAAIVHPVATATTVVVPCKQGGAPPVAQATTAWEEDALPDVALCDAVEVRAFV
jgi:hypothetical protein